MADSWKIDGDCETCRKKPYCKKSCSLHKKMIKEYLWKTFQERLTAQVQKDKEAGLLDDVCDASGDDVSLDRQEMPGVRDVAEFVGHEVPDGDGDSAETV